MIPYEIRQAIMALKAQGRTLRDISRIVRVSRNTVRRALRQPQAPARRDNPEHEALRARLPEIYRRCRGNAVRIQEILNAEQRIEIPSSTLTRLIRRSGYREPKHRVGIYVFEPGAEMQQDTSPHRVSVCEKTLTAQCAALVLAYSRYLFTQYYSTFTRFEAKSFLTEALRFFEGVCPRCTIDNTSVIVAGGSGPEALIAPEMVAFGELFGTRFIPHAIGHADRKGRVERPFAYIEGNFLAGRCFRDWADLNTQARSWCEEVANAKPKRALGMSPKAAYAMEKPHLLPLPPHIPPVTQIHYRVVDTQGYVHLDTNRYSVPERWLGEKVAVHKQPEQVLIFAGHALVAEHPRLLGEREIVHLIASHHPSLHRGRTPTGPSPQEQALTGRHPVLDR
ncbi:MAG: Mu transposase domain-containing protein [Gammaproteobacteria bacterium]